MTRFWLRLCLIYLDGFLLNLLRRLIEAQIIENKEVWNTDFRPLKFNQKLVSSYFFSWYPWEFECLWGFALLPVLVTVLDFSHNFVLSPFSTACRMKGGSTVSACQRLIFTGVGCLYSVLDWLCVFLLFCSDFLFCF